MTMRQTPAGFWSRVKKGKTSECWEWTGARNNTGYGTVAWLGKVYVAHRVAAWLVDMVATPSAPKSSATKTHVLHKCDNRACCNPKHFFLGSFSDNQLDAYLKKRKVQPQGEKHSNAKLTNKQAQEIRRRYGAGEMQVPLAKEFGISQKVVSNIVRGASYR